MSSTSSTVSVFHGIDREWATEMRKQRDALEVDADRLEQAYKELSAQGITKLNWSKRRDIETDFVHLTQRTIHWKNEVRTMIQNDFSVEPDEMMKRIEGFEKMLRETLSSVNFLAVDGRRLEPAGEIEETRRQAALAKLDQRTDAEMPWHPTP